METVSDAPTRVVVVDDDVVVSEIMTLSISKDRSLTLVGVARACADAVATVAREHPDVVLLNCHSSEQECASIVSELVVKSPDVKIVKVSSERSSDLPDALGDDGTAVVGRDSSIAEILRVIRLAGRHSLAQH